MSHFGVLVITNEKPTEDLLAEILAPWHEFECTGMVNEYVQNIDELPEALDMYEGEESRLRAPDGSLHLPWADQFYRDPTPEENSYSRINFIPEGWEEITVSRKELYTFAEFVADYYERPILLEEPDLEDEHKWGWYQLDENGAVVELVRRTNPNAKWDWWTVGGRWSGFLTPRSFAKGIEKGEPGLMGAQADPHGVDIARKCDVDFEAMRGQARYEARAKWRRVHDLVGHLLKDFVLWETVREDMFPEDIQVAREFYSEQLAQKAMRSNEDLRFWCLEDFLIPLEEYETQRGNSATTTFAFVKDGQWIERGNMGFWAMVTNEQNPDEWADAFNQMLDELPEETWLTVVDCHI